MTRKFSLLTAAALPLIPAALFACGGDDGPKVMVKPDAAMGSGSGSGSQAVCAAMASYGAVAGLTEQTARYSSDANGSAAGSAEKSLSWTGKQTDGTFLRVILFGNCGSGSQGSGSGCTDPTPDFPNGFTAPVSLDISTQRGAQQALFILLADLNMSTNRFDTIYLGTAGTLNITTAANGSNMPFAGNGANLDLVHIDVTGPQIVEHADGCTSAVTSFQWSATTGSNTAATAKPEFIEAGTKEEALRKYLSNRTY